MPYAHFAPLNWVKKVLHSGICNNALLSCQAGFVRNEGTKLIYKYKHRLIIMHNIHSLDLYLKYNTFIGASVTSSEMFLLVLVMNRMQTFVEDPYNNCYQQNFKEKNTDVDT